MNWLAHMLLSEPEPAFRVGNLLPDLMSQPELVAVPTRYHRGIERHRQIDAFTDSHLVVRRSICRIDPAYRRFGGVLVDLFYDHFLAVGWDRYSPVPLPDFVADVYASFESHDGDLPEKICANLRRMGQEDLLGSYRQTAGIAQALRRLERRLRRPVELAPAVRVLEEHYSELRADFEEFFPVLQAKWPEVNFVARE